MKRAAFAVVVVVCVVGFQSRAGTGRRRLRRRAGHRRRRPRPIENATIVVNAGKIAQVGRAADVKAPAGATRISLTGKTVMPTIVDTHVHRARRARR